MWEKMIDLEYLRTKWFHEISSILTEYSYNMQLIAAHVYLKLQSYPSKLAIYGSSISRYKNALKS